MKGRATGVCGAPSAGNQHGGGWSKVWQVVAPSTAASPIRRVFSRLVKISNRGVAMGGRRSSITSEARAAGQSPVSSSAEPYSGTAGLPLCEGASRAASEISQNKFASAVDLFGEPILPSLGRPGRPRHMPTEASRQQVRALRRLGNTQLEIAASIGITHPTLLLNYADELGSKSTTAQRRAAHDRARTINQNGGNDD